MRLMSSALLIAVVAVAVVAGAVADNSASHAVDGDNHQDQPSGSQSGSQSHPSWHRGNHTWHPRPHHGNHTWHPRPHGNHTWHPRPHHGNHTWHPRPHGNHTWHPRPHHGNHTWHPRPHGNHTWRPEHGGQQSGSQSHHAAGDEAPTQTSDDVLRGPLVPVLGLALLAAVLTAVVFALRHRRLAAANAAQYKAVVLVNGDVDTTRVVIDV